METFITAVTTSNPFFLIPPYELLRSTTSNENVKVLIGIVRNRFICEQMFEEIFSIYWPHTIRNEALLELAGEHQSRSGLVTP
jgi:hypothetical protein